MKDFEMLNYLAFKSFQLQDHQRSKSTSKTYLVMHRVVISSMSLTGPPTNLGIQMVDKIGLADLFGESPIKH